MLSIDECWDFLETCAGAGASVLPPGADADSIRHAEEAMGVSFPEDFRRFLGRHDGSGPYFIVPWKLGGGEQRFVGLGEMVHLRQAMAEIGAEFESEGEFGEQIGPVRRSYWNRCWVPLTDNGCGDNIFIDLAPAETGTVGQVVDWWHEGGVSTFLATGLREFLNDIVGEVRNGIYGLHK